MKQNYNILIIDGNFRSQRLIEKFLKLAENEKKNKYQFEKLLKWEKGTNLINKEQDLIVLILLIPDIRKVEEYEEIRLCYPDTPMIILTSHRILWEMIKKRIIEKKRRESDYLLKHPDPEVLNLIIKLILERKTMSKVPNKQITEDLLRQYLKIVAIIIDEKDSFCKGHSERVKDISLNIAKKLGLLNEQSKIELLAYMHDITRLGSNTDLLNTSRWNDSKHIKTDIQFIEFLFSLIRHLYRVKNGMNHYYEKFLSLRNTKFKESPPSILEQVVAVSDAYDVLTTASHFNNRLSKKEAIKTLSSKFDKNVINALKTTIQLN